MKLGTSEADRSYFCIWLLVLLGPLFVVGCSDSVDRDQSVELVIERSTLREIESICVVDQISDSESKVLLGDQAIDDGMASEIESAVSDCVEPISRE